MHVIEHVLDGLLDGVELRGRGDRRVHQTSNVLHRHGQVTQDLKNRHRLGDVLVKL